MEQYAFVMIKPHAVKLADPILKDLDEHGSRLESITIEQLPLEIMQLHYGPHKGKYYFNAMVEDFIGKPSQIAIYGGNIGIIQNLREIIGPINPLHAPKNTIRGKYLAKGEDPRILIEEGRYFLRNFVHCSDSPGEAKRELEIWGQYFSQKTRDEIQIFCNFPTNQNT